MDVSIIDMALQAILILLEPERLAFLALGVVFGLALGVVPGLSGIVGLALLLPYTWDMDAYSALAFLMGLASVVTTADTIPTVLFGVPGTVGSAATIMDGFPMAKKGEAGRAFGAAFSASVMGGLVGAILLAASIPVMRPLILSLGTPDQLAFCIFGTAGDDPQTGTLRWTFNFLYLWDGLHIVPMALGLFALPEIADLVIRGKSIEGDEVNREQIRRTQYDGMRDVRRSWWLVLRCGSIGAALGAVPGVGAAVIDWVAYGHAARTEIGATRSFGLGDVRGVIASEASNNAKEGGALIPTIAFGVPGSASMALILGAFLIHGIVPGPDMLSKKLDVTFTLVWSVALANLLGAGLCFLFAGQLARIAMVRIGVLAPVVLAFVFIGAFQGSRAWGDIVAVLVFGLLGWAMKRLRWPRPPLMLGFVLGEVIEQYMFISFQLYVWDWLTRPVVIVMLLIAVYGIVRPIARDRAARRNAGESAPRTFGFRRDKLNGELIFNAILFVLFVNTLIVSSQWDIGARLVPQVIGWFGAAFVGLKIALDLFFQPVETGQPESGTGAVSFHFDNVMDFGELTQSEVRKRGAVFFAWCVGFFLVALVIGLLPAILVFMIAYMRVAARESWTMTLSVSLTLWIFAYALFHKTLHIAWPQSLLGDWFPALRFAESIALF
jgi:TctA family transporter